MGASSGGRYRTLRITWRARLRTWESPSAIGARRRSVGSKPGDRVRQSVFDRDAWPEIEHGGGCGDICAGVADVARARRSRLDDRTGMASGPDDVRNISDRARVSGAYVKYAARFRVAADRRNDGIDDVGYVHEVPRLPAVAVDGQRMIGDCLAAEQRYHAGVRASGILARAIDIEQPKPDAKDAVHAA